jgi:hypothetical protein
LYRKNPDLRHLTQFSNQGNEVAFGTIGNASTAEGLFWESINAIGVLQIPVLMSVWDDGYGISVPNEYQMTKGDISAIMAGFQRDADGPGYELFQVRGWDYPALCEVYAQAAQICREEHVPVFIHVTEITQPQGHSTSGSHERYKSKERLAWEAAHDGIRKMREWMIESGIATVAEVDAIEKEAKETAREARNTAWNDFMNSILPDQNEALRLLAEAARVSAHGVQLQALAEALARTNNPIRSDALSTVKKALRLLRNETGKHRTQLIAWVERVEAENRERYNSHLYSESNQAVVRVRR